MFACPRSPCEPTDWSIDGRALLVNAGTDVWTVPVDTREPPAPLLSSPVPRARCTLLARWLDGSPTSPTESGRPEVSIRNVTGPLRRIVVSNQGGDQPVWQSDGSALFYVDHEHLLQRVTLHPSPDGGLTLGRPERVRVPPSRQAIGARPTTSRRTARGSSCRKRQRNRRPRRSRSSWAGAPSSSSTRLALAAPAYQVRTIDLAEEATSWTLCRRGSSNGAVNSASSINSRSLVSAVSAADFACRSPNSQTGSIRSAGILDELDHVRASYPHRRKWQKKVQPVKKTSRLRRFQCGCWLTTSNGQRHRLRAHQSAMSCRGQG